MVTIAMLFTTLFLGGWDIPFTHWDETLGMAQFVVTAFVFFGKSLFFLFLFMWIRWTLPRFRYDQLMALGLEGVHPDGPGVRACSSPSRSGWSRARSGVTSPAARSGSSSCSTSRCWCSCSASSTAGA